MKGHLKNGRCLGEPSKTREQACFLNYACYDMAGKGDHNKTYLYTLFTTKPVRKDNKFCIIYSSYTSTCCFVR